MKAIAERRSQLEAMKADLLERLEYLNNASTGGVGIEARERESESNKRNKKEGQHELRLIDAALARIDADEYGVCTSCGNRISTERLDILPFAPQCKACARTA